MLRSIALPALVVLAAGLLTSTVRGQVVNSQWVPASGNWNVAGNWSPAAAPNNGPATYNVQIGTLAPTGAQVTFVPVIGTSATISSLSLTDSADLFTNGAQLNVLGQTTIDGVGATIRVDENATPANASLTTVDLDLNNGGGLTMAGGIVNVSAQLEINAGSVLGGHGTVNVGDGGVASQAFENSALLQVQGNTAAPQTLTIHANGSDTIDLDGDSETGIVDVDNALANVNADTVTLVIDGPLADGFGGLAGAAIQIGQRDTLTFNDNFTIAGPAAISMNGGNAVATLNGAGDITSIAGATFSMTGATVINNDMTFTGTANTITVNANSSLTLGGTVSIPDASALVLAAGTSGLIVSGATTITEVGADFNWDGPSVAATTVKGSGHLTLDVNRLDIGDNVYGGTLTLEDNADLTVLLTATQWTMAGSLNKNNAGVSAINGEDINVTSAINVNSGILDINVPMILAGTSTVTVAAGGQGEFFTTTLAAGSNLTVNGILGIGLGSVLAGPATINGTGVFRLLSTSTVTANTTVNTTTFDWDGLTAGTAHTINAGIVFTINSTVFDGDGDMDDPLSLGGNGGQLIVNGVSNWTMAAALTTNPTAVGTATIGGTARMTLDGAGVTWTVTGNTTASAPVTFGSSATTIAATRTLRLAGGDNNLNPNVMAGGTIGGGGTLAANDARELRGFGNIGAIIDFDDTARLRADDGTLTISGTISDVGVIGTADADGVLNVTNAWNSNVAAGVALLGGTVQGGPITNDSPSGIQGFGSVTARVINNTQLLSFNGGTLIFQTAGNDNDWDGTTNAGLLRGTNGTTLELRDNATFGFTGTVQANPGGRVFTNGFALDFNPGSTINLGAGIYESTSSTDIGGTVTVAAGADSTIKVANNFFLTFEGGSNSTLNANLRLENNNINIEDLAVFSGGGALVIPDGSHLVVDNNADVGVLLEMRGAFRPGNFEGIGRVNLVDYQQFDTGELYIEIKGTSLNQFDRLSVTGDVIVDGYLNIDIDEVSPGVPFVPALGNTFNIITGTSVTGAIDYYDVSGMPAGLAFKINYLANAVQLQVVNKPIFSADFDDDGDVDQTDLAIWKGAFHLNQLGDADGDNDSDGNDFLLWQRQLGSKPAAVAAGAPVPEPNGAAMAAAVALLLFVLARRRHELGIACA